MNPFISNFTKSTNFISLLNDIKTEKNNISVIGLTDSAKAHIIAGISKNSDKASLIVCSNSLLATKFVQDLKFFTDEEILYFPAKKIGYYDIEAETKEFSNTRMSIIEKINSGNKNIIVTTIDALLTKMLPSITYKGKDMYIKVGDKINLSEFAKNLDSLGYERCEVVEGKGQFAIRGGIVDVFTLDNELPYRIELFGDEIDNIRTFDALTQRSIDTVKGIHTSYATDNLVSKENKDEIINKLQELTNSKELSSELKKNILADIEKIEAGNIENLIDKYFELLVPNYETLLDYVKDYNIYIDEPLKNIEKAIIAAEIGINVNKYISYEMIEQKLKHMTNIYLESINTDKSIHKNRKSYYFTSREENFYKASMEVLVNDITKARDRIVLLVYPTASRVEQIKNYLLSNEILVNQIDGISSCSCEIGKVYITQGILSSGFYSEEFNFLIIAEPVSGINLSKPKKIKKNSIGQSINTYADLQVGDFVVHENHGIGIYRGVEAISVQNIKKDYIKIEYADKGVLYVPINQLDSVGKYVCDDDTVPKLNVLGTKEWEKTKSKVIKHVEEIAKELVLLYAKREQAIGFI